MTLLDPNDIPRWGGRRLVFVKALGFYIGKGRTSVSALKKRMMSTPDGRKAFLPGRPWRVDFDDVIAWQKNHLDHQVRDAYPEKTSSRERS